MALTDAQQSEYRKNIRDNSRKAVELARSLEGDQGKALEALVEVGLSVSTGLVCVAERVGEQTESMAGNEMALRVITGHYNTMKHMLSELIETALDDDSTAEDIREKANLYKDALESAEEISEQDGGFFGAAPFPS